MSIISTPHQERDTLYFHSTPTPVPIFQREWEFAQLLRIYEARAPGAALEIGTFHGGTLYHWLRLARPNTIVVSVDSYAAGVDNRHRYAHWTPAGVTLHTLAGNSRDPSIIAQVRALGPFDFVFIDAGHLEHEVQADWEHFGAMCVSGGVVALHDIMPAAVDWIEVDRVWERIQHQGYMTQELVCAPDLDWGGIGCVFMR
jgi:predicted O-methyltransferase YrrM